MQDLKSQKEWMVDLVKQSKPIRSGTESQRYRLMQGLCPSHQPKKKKDKKQLINDIFEIDFMCD
jgi:hypothetical protein